MNTRIDGRVTVLGAGTMGHGIAHVAALAGYDTVLFDASPEALTHGLGRIARNLDKGVQLGKVESSAASRALERAGWTTSARSSRRARRRT